MDFLRPYSSRLSLQSDRNNIILCIRAVLFCITMYRERFPFTRCHRPAAAAAAAPSCRSSHRLHHKFSGINVYCRYAKLGTDSLIRVIILYLQLLISYYVLQLIQSILFLFHSPCNQVNSYYAHSHYRTIIGVNLMNAFL